MQAQISLDEIMYEDAYLSADMAFARDEAHEVQREQDRQRYATTAAQIPLAHVADLVCDGLRSDDAGALYQILVETQADPFTPGDRPRLNHEQLTHLGVQVVHLIAGAFDHLVGQAMAVEG